MSPPGTKAQRAIWPLHPFKAKSQDAEGNDLRNSIRPWHFPIATDDPSVVVTRDRGFRFTRHYVPTEAERATMDTIYPHCNAAERPPWHRIQANLIGLGYKAGDLQNLSVPSIMTMLEQRGTPPPAAPSPQSSPAWKRLNVRETRSGDTADLDGKTYRLRGGRDAAFLKALQEAEGGPRKANDLESVLCERPSRIYKRLAKELQEIIDKPGRG